MQWDWKTNIEPFKFKSVEPLKVTTREERGVVLREAGFNLFNIPADKVLIDLFSDSGTSAMSSAQWSGILRGDESYAGSESFRRLADQVRDLTGYGEVLPVYHGRAAERALFGLLGAKGKTIPANAYDDTMRLNVEATGAQALDIPVPGSAEHRTSDAFKGDMYSLALEGVFKDKGAENIPAVLLMVTNSSLGGQPVAMSNIREVSEICLHHKTPLFLDASRFAENAYLIKKREGGYARRPVAEIVHEMFSYAQGCLMSARKDALSSTGGFLALRDAGLAALVRAAINSGEGAGAYGGLAGRDMESMAAGLKEAIGEDYLRHRIESVEFLAKGLREAGLPIVEPSGGHAVFVDAGAFLPHVPPNEYPALALACELYLSSGIRSAEVGSLMSGRDGSAFKPARLELLRLALPRRVYTRSHLEFVIEVFTRIAAHPQRVRGMRLLQPSRSVHPLGARLEPIPL